MDKESACFIAFENDQTRTLVERGWRLVIIDTDIWPSMINGWVPRQRYIVHGQRPHPSGHGTYGTMASGDTPADAVAAFAQRIIDLHLQDETHA